MYEVATTKEIGGWTTHLSQTRAAQFTADGKTVSTGCTDGSALFWDMLNLPWDDDEPGSHSLPKEPDKLWDALDAEDATLGYRAVCELAKNAPDGVRIFKERLKPAPSRDRGLVNRLIVNLDSDDRAVREAAQKALAKLNGLAEPELRDAVKNPRSAEVQKQAEALLAKIEPLKIEPGRLREIRAVQVFEYSGGPESRELLEDLAKGEPLAELTKDARAALKRLDLLRVSRAAPKNK